MTGLVLSWSEWARCDWDRPPPPDIPIQRQLTPAASLASTRGESLPHIDGAAPIHSRASGPLCCVVGLFGISSHICKRDRAMPGGAMPPQLSAHLKMVAPYLVEFTGTLFLTLVVSLTGKSTVTGQAPIAIGLMLAAMIYMGGHVSGANYNPAVSMAVLVRGNSACRSSQDTSSCRCSARCARRAWARSRSARRTRRCRNQALTS